MIVLASQSRSRAKLLEAAGVPFVAVPARVDEEEVRRSLLSDGQDGAAIAEVLAELKALRISSSRPQDLVIGADQILSFEGEVIAKCASLKDAEALLRRLRGRKHLLVGSVVLARNGAPIWRRRSKVQLSMRDFSDAFLFDYLREEGEGLLESVGCYRFEGRGIQLFDAAAGDYFAILGLDLLPLLAALREQGALTV